MAELPHLDESGAARMVDVSSKADTRRTAVAEAVIELSTATADLLFSGGLEKGDALAVARVAGIMAAKRTSDLIPLCHPLAISSVDVDISRVVDGARIETRVTTTGPTGVEMEALTAASVAALALYDMIKSHERGASVSRVQLLAKSGGRSGTWTR
jgi:cyclic pyranopterin phosphate synthase